MMPCRREGIYEIWRIGFCRGNRNVVKSWSTCNSVCLVSTLRFLELPFDQWLKSPRGVHSRGSPLGTFCHSLGDSLAAYLALIYLGWLDLSFWSFLYFIFNQSCILNFNSRCLKISFCWWSGIPDGIPIQLLSVQFQPGQRNHLVSSPHDKVGCKVYSRK